MQQYIILFSTIFIVIIQASPFQNIQPLQENLEYRLPTTIYPNHYDIEITPYFNVSNENQRFTFDGICTITLITTQNDVNEIVLHANNLNINYETMELKTLIATVPVNFNNYNIDTHKLTLSVENPLTPNIMYQLKFEYTGQLLDDMEGFYRSSYIQNGVKKWLGATQMQATSARRVFPCFDEPSFKATFTLTIKRPLNFRTIANTRMVSSEMEGDVMVERFVTTPIMSTYLLAFIVSEFEGRLTNNQNFGVYARPNAYAQTGYAFDFGQQTLNALNIWLDYDYYSLGNVDKMDMVAIPDFAAGAMENWGLLTYRETAMLYDAEVSTTMAKQRVATVIVHEQAHMWFGNLVTCHWWEFTWLNEGFARYFQYFLTHMVQADWDLDLQYVVEQIQVVFAMDALETTHPLTHSVNTPSEISAIFDNISYNKGSAIIRMIEHIMGIQNFQNALRNYLKDNAFSSTTPEKLYAAFDQQTNEDIANIMNLWTTQPGYPVVFVDVQPNRMSARITQKRFLINNNDYNQSTAWDIPLNFVHKNQLSFDNTLPTKWLKNTEESIVEEFGTDITWIICNLKQTGYYRVNYDDVTWGYIEDALKSERHSDIHVLNRAQVIDDVMNLARAGHITYERALPIFDYLRNEEHYIPWTAALNAMSFIINRTPSQQLESVQSYFLNLITNIYVKLGFYEKNNDTHLEILNRMKIVSFACKLGHADCVATAKLEFNKLKENANYRVPNNLRPVVYCTGIAEGSKSDWDYLWNRYLTENNAAEQTVILTALGCTKNADQLYIFIDNILSENVRSQDKLAALTAAYTERKRNSLNVLLYVLEPEIYKQLSELGYLNSIISGLVARITVVVEIILITYYIPDLEDPKELLNGLVEAQMNVNWTGNNMPAINEMIEKLMYTQLEIKYRLPKNIEPISYQIELTPYFENDLKPFTFDGTAEIVLKINENVNEIVLHKHNLNIIDTSLLRGSIDVEIIHQEYMEETHKLHLYTAEALQIDETYILHFNFTGEIGEDMAGFYRSSYQDVNGITNWLATTQMQPASARRVFPCFDEPNFKATFNVIMNRPTSYLPTISNTKLLDSYVPAGSNRTRETFATTPKMSTYLLAFIVSKFVRHTNGSFSVYARPEALQQTGYAVDVGVKLLNELGKWIDYEYNSVNEIEKMDMAAIPDFSAGAMENWGLLTYRETAVLYEENTSTAKAKQRVAGVIAHEQAHLWFGDLVTCDWWKYTWLNEGFARYFQYFGTALVEKDWNLDLQYVVEQIHSVFAIDALETTHPMTNDVNTPSEISGIFDSISYSKGSAIIRMIEHLMGSAKFQTALREYIKEREFKTTTPQHLYEHLKNHADPTINIDLIMDSWTTQSGYPVVTVEVQADKQHVLVGQNHFIVNSNINDHNLDTTWFIPLNYVTQLQSDFTDTQSKEILRNSERSKQINIGSNIDWIIFNVQQTGYYRVNYDSENWNNIGNALKSPNHEGIHIINRAQIIDDVMNLARARLIDYNTVFSILKYLENEENYIPWSTAFNNLAFLLDRMNDDDLLTGKKYILKLIGNIYNKLGFDEKNDDSHIDILNREIVLTYACKYGHEGCITKSKELYAKLVDEKIEVPPNIRSVVYCTAIANGGISEWNFFYDKFRNSNVAAEQSVILTALGCSKDTTIIREYISKIINTNDIRQQDKTAAFTATYTGDENNVDLVIDVIKSSFQIIHAKLNVYSLLTGIASKTRNFNQLNEINAILTNHGYDRSNDGLNNAIRNAEYNIYWANSNMQRIIDLMTDYINSMAAKITSGGLLLIVGLTILSNYLI